MSLKKLLKPFKLISIARRSGVVTVLYPYQKPLITTEFRGKISIDATKCMGCGACVNACPPNALTLSRRDDTIILNYFIGRCIFCGRCAEVCPVGAITVTHEFELASTSTRDLNESLVHRIERCSGCGGGLGATSRMLQYVILHSPASENYVHLCPDCRKKKLIQSLAMKMGARTEDYEG